MENYAQDEESSTHLLLDDESSDHQLSDDEQFERWSQQHSELQRQIEAIERRPYVTEADDLEEQRLKKLKLHIKDRMNGMLSFQKKAAGA